MSHNTALHRSLVLVWALALLSACTSLQTIQPTGWAARQAELLKLEDWELRGRMAFRSGEEGGQGKLHWQQAGAISFINIAGPFGAGAYDLVWEPGRVSVADATGKRSVEYTGADAAEQFMREQLGWSFPAVSARYWVMGLLDPADPGDEHFDDQSVLSGITQHGWNISYERFAEFDGFALPTRINMENGTASLRMVISKWSAPVPEH
jgi:outer membrane lipoprotein LolB